MPSDNPQRLYEQLADQCQQRGESQQRDVFLVLAANAALEQGRRDEAERLRQQLLAKSPYHLLRPFASFAEALESADIREYVAELSLQHPPHLARQLLESDRASSLLPTDIFEGSTETEIIFPLSSPSTPFEDRPAAARPEPARARPAPALHVPPPPPPAKASPPPTPSAKASAPPAKAKPRRRSSPYDNPDYGPRLPADAKPRQDIAGIWFIYMLVGLVGLLAVSALAFVLIRPFVR